MALGIWLIGFHLARRRAPAGAGRRGRLHVLLVAGISGRRASTGRCSRAASSACAGSIETADRRFHYRDGRTATVKRRNRHEATVLIATNGGRRGAADRVARAAGAPGAKPVPLTRDVATRCCPGPDPRARPHARSAEVIGPWLGDVVAFLLGSPHLERVTTIEIEPEMIEGSRSSPANRRVFEERIRFAIEDGARFFRGGRYPLRLLFGALESVVSGVSSLFEGVLRPGRSPSLAQRRVGHGSISNEIDDNLIPAFSPRCRAVSVVRAVTPRRTTAHRGQSPGVTPAADGRCCSSPVSRRNLKRVVPITSQTLDVLRAGGRATFGPLLDREVTANSDFERLLDLGAERGRYLSQTAEGFASLNTPRFNMVAALERRRIPLATEAWTATPEIDVARAATVSARLRASESLRPRDDEGDSEIAMRSTGSARSGDAARMSRRRLGALFARSRRSSRSAWSAAATRREVIRRAAALSRACRCSGHHGGHRGVHAWLAAWDFAARRGPLTGSWRILR